MSQTNQKKMKDNSGNFIKLLASLTSYVDDKSRSAGAQLKETSILKSNHQNMVNIEITDNLENTFDSNMKAKSDLVYHQNNLEDVYEDSKVPKTSHNNLRVIVDHNKTQNQQNITSNTKSEAPPVLFKGDMILSEVSHASQNRYKTANFVKNSSNCTNKNEIYLNKNSAEENPDSVDEIGRGNALIFYLAFIQ